MNATGAALRALIFAPLLCCAPTSSLGCACCSDEGQYLGESGKPSDLQIAEMHYMQFAADARLYLGPGDLHNVKGIRAPSETYGLQANFHERTKSWTLVFRNEGANTGTLTLPIGTAKMLTLRVDIHDGRKSAGGGPSIYKEWKFSGRVKGDGIFAAGLATPAEYTLMFQGRGNNCDGASDFTHWRLAVSGPKADFTFIGKLAPGDDEQRKELRDAPQLDER